jgi:hypothetical protein
VNAPLGPSVASSRRDKIRSAIWTLRHARKLEVQRALGFNSLQDRDVAKFNPGAARRLTTYLDATLPCAGRHWPNSRPSAPAFRLPSTRSPRAALAG